MEKELAEPIKNIESLVQLRDLLQIGLPDNTYLVHRDADIGVCPADGLRLDALPEKSRQHGTMFWPRRYAGSDRAHMGRRSSWPVWTRSVSMTFPLC